VSATAARSASVTPLQLTFIVLWAMTDCSTCGGAGQVWRMRMRRRTRSELRACPRCRDYTRVLEALGMDLEDNPILRAVEGQ
jgi:hypothetical protein